MRMCVRPQTALLPMVASKCLFGPVKSTTIDAIVMP